MLGIHGYVYLCNMHGTHCLYLNIKEKKKYQEPFQNSELLANWPDSAKKAG